MTELAVTAPAFIEMAHRIVWATAATVDSAGRPRSRILHPFWQWDGTSLVGWIATGPTPTKRDNLDRNPYVSVTYWTTNHDTCTAECRVEWAFDDDTRRWVWDLFEATDPPLGYDPALIPAWADGPTSAAFAALRLEPWRLRVLPGTAMLGGGGEVLRWAG
jgi:Pyridoxamine 5'-phosphate oxidase